MYHAIKDNELPKNFNFKKAQFTVAFYSSWAKYEFMVITDPFTCDDAVEYYEGLVPHALVPMAIVAYTDKIEDGVIVAVMRDFETSIYHPQLTQYLKPKGFGNKPKAAKRKHVIYDKLK